MEQLKGITEEILFSSEALGEDIEVLIYKPSTFSPLYKHHLLIAQDGQDYFNLGKISRVVEELLEQKRFPNTLVIGIPYSNVEERRERYHPDGKQHDSYTRFLAHELVPYLDEHYPTYQMGRGRALLGDSLGGSVALLTALKYPHTFGKVAMQSPFINEKIVEKMKQFTSTHLLQIYQEIGTLETAVETTDGIIKDFVTPNRVLAEIIKEKGFESSYHEFNGDHTWTHWQPNLKSLLEYILND